MNRSTILPTFGTGQAIWGWFSGHTRSFSDYPMHVYLSMPADVPWQQVPLTEALSMEQLGAVQVLTGRTTLRRLLDARGCIAENEVFLMRV